MARATPFSFRQSCDLINRMKEIITEAYKNPHKHITSSEIIRQYSTNKDDIREIALAGLDLSDVHDVLDLGCGFGYMSRPVSLRTSAGALFLGVDVCPENLPFFLEAVRASGRNAEFIHYHIVNSLPWDSESFDFIIASYSLYFFAEIIPEIARVLRPHGIFLAITHSQDSFSGLYAASNLNDNNTPIDKLISNFSGENGEEKLDPFFDEIDCITYENSLRFNKENIDDLIEYTRFKYPLMLTPEQQTHNELAKLPSEIEASIKETLFKAKQVNIKKNDVIFRCRRPRCP